MSDSTSEPLRHRIVVGMIWSGPGLLLQLRDFRNDIADPGQWGLFGGHLRLHEAPELGLKRELFEELAWTPREFVALGQFDEPDRTIVGYRMNLDIPTDSLVIAEGQDFGIFTPHEISYGRLYSQRLKQAFPLTAITGRAMAMWMELRS